MNVPQCRHRGGLSLIELLIALAIIAVAFAALAVTQVGNLRITSESRLASEATELANEHLEAAYECVVRSPENFRAAAELCGDGRDISQGRFEGHLTVGPLGEGTAYHEEGVVLIRADITTPSSVTFARVVSCMDVEPAPAIAAPGPCPPAVIQD